ncbi:efflux RND transporter periplasmic adaptor subunit [Thermodesulfobacteriota bacterium]
MKRTTRGLLQLLIVVVLIAAGVMGMRTLMASKAPLKRKKPPTPLPMVRVLEVRSGKHPVPILGQGTVRPVREIQFVPQVDGKVVYTSAALVDGGSFQKGEVLLRIDPVDYELAVSLYESKLKDSESALKLLEEQAAAARDEWNEVYNDGTEAKQKPPPLVVKEPQLAATNAKLAANRAELRKALLQLERTELRAPFNGRVSQEKVDIGQYISPGQAVATLYSTEAAEIIVQMENEDLFWFHVPGFTPGSGPGAQVKVRAHVAGRELSWTGNVVRAGGKLDERTRMINVVIRVEKPYQKKPPLAPGLFVTVEIEGRVMQKAAIIPRSALHQGDVVWVVDEEGRLHFRKVKVARFSGEGVVTSDGLEDGDRIVISTIKAVTAGMKVRIALTNGENGS